VRQFDLATPGLEFRHRASDRCDRVLSGEFG
jgi:hypothetical protein